MPNIIAPLPKSESLADALLGLGNPLAIGSVGISKGKSLLDFIVDIKQSGGKSVEELSRRRNYFYLNKGGKVSPLFKQRDIEFPLREGEAILSVDPGGAMEVANSMGLGKDPEVLSRLGGKLRKFLEMQMRAK